MNRIVVLLIALVALTAGAFLADRTLLRAEAESAAPPEAQRSLPPLVLPGLGEAAVDLDDFKGQPLLVNFWATWCKPCRREIPLLLTLRETHATQGLEVIGIAIDELEITREMAGTLGINYPVMVGEQEGIEALIAFGAPTTALPFTAAVSRDGYIVAGHVGELKAEDAARLLEAVL